MIFYSEFSEQLPVDPERMSYAKSVESYELTRRPDNDGKPLDPGYLEKQTAVRELFVEAIVNGTLYSEGSPEQFISKLKAAHVEANKDDVYKRVGSGINEFIPGEFILEDDEPFNFRYPEALGVAELARSYGDPYKDRFLGQKSYVLKLDDLETSWLPMDIYDPENYDGRLRYVYYYPSGEAIPVYMEKINEIGLEIVRTLKESPQETDKIVDLIARQYQYGACIRPFPQVNNSLFMNLVNAQLKLAGLEGLSHYDLDFAAQRILPDSFVKYFKDRVYKRI